MLTVYTLDQSEQWDGIVKSFCDYDVYWLSGYVKAFHIHGDGDPLLIYYEKDGTRGINVVMKRDVALVPHFQGKIPENECFDFATPYGYGGWIIEGEDTDALFTAYEKWAHENNIVSEFVRFHPMVENHDKASGHYEIVQLGQVVHMDLSSSETIWNNLTSKNRNMIRKAVKNGLEVRHASSPEMYEEFRCIYNATMDRVNADEYYYFKPEFYTSLLNDLKDNAQVFWAEKDGEIAAASIILYANGRMNYHLSGNLRLYGSLAPGNLILYNAALWGCENGYETFHLGGGVGSGEDHLLQFKRAFYKGDLNHF